MYQIAIIGSESSVDKNREVKEFIYKIKSTFGQTATILSGGNKTGIEKEIKNLALINQIPYKEFNPSFTGHNVHSAEKEEYYIKGFHPSHFLHRYNLMLRKCDRLVIVECDDAPDKKLYDQVKKTALKKGIKTMII